ncbi:sensor histidine kinase [Nocardiopsis composta]|uniref:histidine kinase n=1 Tax=Nocardiopsis composta TaxID=157465 RepID=A0A7W8QSS0_9ACTN|nr:sensor histidine kinase [Nocardiopsis composta]MBB5435920.1 signal transduction histidine kinase [Nocardiopsis composta]
MALKPPRPVRAGVRSALYLCVTLGSALATLLVPPLLLLSAATLLLAGAGLVTVPFALDRLRDWADLERRRIGRFLGEEIPAPHLPAPSAGLGPARFRALLLAPRTRRDLAWVFTQIGLGIPLGAIGLAVLFGIPVTAAQILLWWVAPADEPLTLLAVPVASWPVALGAGAAQLAVLGWLLWAAPWLARLHARAARALLAPSSAEELEERVEELTETRAGAVHAHAAELRRIERDLHDGTQARLVALAMRLGLAQRTLGRDPEAAARLLEQAQAGAEEAMTELRAVVRTIYPPVLADRGLAGALSALAADSAVPVRLDIGEPGGADLAGLPAAVEATAYFVVAESLTNVAKHAEASRAEVQVARDGAELRVRVADDGRGGADEAGGSGVAGMRRRVAALDGGLAVSSPPGGPTRVEAVLPCGE